MENKEKETIEKSLKNYVDKFPSQNKAAQSLAGTSAGTISQILSGKWTLISDEMWKKIASQVSTSENNEWAIVETTPYQELSFAIGDAQKWKNVTWIVGEAGCGKTTAAKAYQETHKEAFYILCSEDMKRSDFIREIAHKIGIKTDGCSLRETLESVMDELVQMENPILLFDEADKLTDTVFHYFITIYNRVEDQCGICFFSTNYIQRRMSAGLRNNKKGYNEMHSRIGRKFFELEKTTSRDVYTIAMQNGLTDKKEISEVIHDAEGYAFDLRRVKKAIHKIKRMRENND